MAKYSDELIGVARSLYLRHWTPKEIANELNLPNARIIYYWATKWSWADMLSHESIEETINRRIQVLTHRDGKTELEHKELDSLIAHHCKLRIQQAKHAEKLAAAASQGNGGYSAAGDGNQDTGKKKRKYRKNDISALAQEDFDAFADEHLFGYQKHLRLNITQQIRNILKSRQIGATWYFAFEALENAVMTGDPQIFLSASRPQAEVFRSYIVNIAEQYFGVTLTGNPIRLSNGAELRFLSTNSNTAQSYSGHLYVDEYFWIQNFARLNEVASAMATHDRWRTTYFSTPSSKTHQAYPFWTGEDWKRGGDTSTFVVIAPPLYEGERFRVLATFYWQGMNWKHQANQIKALFERYNMTHIGIDITGIGSGVFEMVQGFAMRQAVAIHYGLESKTRLVLKMVDVVESQRIEWDSEQKEIPASFLAIRRTSTTKGNSMTFVADRTQETGHADVFFAIAHAVDNEPLNFENQRKSTWKTRKAA
ncbi:terminase large subunit domain-containing protein [Serratia marcescens]|uniref:terminase large subunit domain-containing protein n=1 Tax=Serratia marcescens TaxID=615 RepID=UPI003FA6AC43